MERNYSPGTTSDEDDLIDWIDKSDGDENSEMDNSKKIKLDVESIKDESEEDLVSKAMEASPAEYKLLETNVEKTFKILITNFPDTDPAALRALCQKFEGQSADLEKFLQDNIQELPTRVGMEKKRLEDQLGEKVRAGVEGSDQMKVESCPRCDHPRIIEDVTVKVFTCLRQSCRGEFCRKCGQEQHFPQECREGKSAEPFFDPSKDFEAISVQPASSLNSGQNFTSMFDTPPAPDSFMFPSSDSRASSSEEGGFNFTGPSPSKKPTTSSPWAHTPSSSEFKMGRPVSSSMEKPNPSTSSEFKLPSFEGRPGKSLDTKESPESHMEGNYLPKAATSRKEGAEGQSFHPADSEGSLKRRVSEQPHEIPTPKHQHVEQEGGKQEEYHQQYLGEEKGGQMTGGGSSGGKEDFIESSGRGSVRKELQEKEMYAGSELPSSEELLMGLLEQQRVAVGSLLPGLREGDRREQEVLDRTRQVSRDIQEYSTKLVGIKDEYRKRLSMFSSFLSKTPGQ